MKVDPATEAERLLGRVEPGWLDDLATDPAATIEVLLEPITVRARPPSPLSGRCAVDGTYQPGPPPRILVADDVVPARQRFTILHELGHHLIEEDDHLNDLDIPDADRRDEEICNEVAATILIPATAVHAMLPAGGFTAADVTALHASLGANASRMACCVAAARRLHRHGCVILGTADGTAHFVAHQPATPLRIARGTPQGAGSLLVAAARASDRHARGITRVRFASGNTSGAVHGDAFKDADGWVYAVIAVDSHSPWATGLNLGILDTGPEGTEIECPHCEGVFTVWERPCPRCDDYRCPNPNCRRCSCPVGAPERVCAGPCGLLKQEHQFRDGGPICKDCE